MPSEERLNEMVKEIRHATREYHASMQSNFIIILVLFEPTDNQAMFGYIIDN